MIVVYIWVHGRCEPIDRLCVKKPPPPKWSDSSGGNSCSRHPSQLSTPCLLSFIQYQTFYPALDPYRRIPPDKHSPFTMVVTDVMYRKYSMIRIPPPQYVDLKSPILPDPTCLPLPCAHVHLSKPHRPSHPPAHRANLPPDASSLHSAPTPRPSAA
jgi:hypothetical protein